MQQILRQALGVILAGVCLYLAFQNADIMRLWHYTQSLNPWYLLLVGVSGLLSHWLRAVRWVILLAPLSQSQISLWNSFCAIMIGYTVNIAIPRGGEIARLVSLAKTEKLPWAGILPTMFIDRLLDLGLLALLLGLTLSLLPASISSHWPWLMPVGICMCIITTAALAMLPLSGRIMKWAVMQTITQKLVPQRGLQILDQLVEQFNQGTKGLVNSASYPAIAGLSLLIWFFYWLNFYLMVLSFGLHKQVNLVQSLVVFTVGSAGVLIPTPGNVGSFHLLVSQALCMVTGVEKPLALAFATVLHLICFIIITCIPAAICFIVQSVLQAQK